MRQLAGWGAAASATAAAATYVLAKLDYFTRFDPLATGAYLTGHWVYWMVMVVFAALAGLLANAAREGGR